MSETLWGPIAAAEWHQVPVVSGRLATESDVAQGRAVFYMKIEGGPQPEPFKLDLPVRALLGDGQTVVVIQAERMDSKVIVGYRNPQGGNGVCTLPELQFVSAPNESLRS